MDGAMRFSPQCTTVDLTAQLPTVPQAAALVAARDADTSLPYMGCYEWRYTRLKLQGKAASKAACGAICRSKGFPYMGRHLDTHCRCGYTVNIHDSIKMPESDCGASGSKCGAGSTSQCTTAEAVYYVPGFRYMGCFKDNQNGVRDLSYTEGSQKKPSTATCAEVCRSAGYKYAGLQGQDQCFCGNTYGSQGKRPDDYCGAGGSMCGVGNTGQCADANAIYETGLMSHFSPAGPHAHIPEITFLNSRLQNRALSHAHQHRSLALVSAPCRPRATGPRALASPMVGQGHRVVARAMFRGGEEFYYLRRPVCVVLPVPVQAL